MIEVLGLFIGTLLIMTKCQKYIFTQIPRSYPVLPDLVHKFSDYLKELNIIDFTRYYTVSDFFIIKSIFTLIFVYNTHLMSFLFDLSIIYLLRTISFTLTILPKCGQMRDKDNNRSCVNILLDYLFFKDLHTGHNNDLLFSGHTAFMTLYCLHFSRFYVTGFFTYLYSYQIWLVNIVLSLINILSKCHYSIDVFYAYIVTIFVFQNIHGSM